MTFAKKLTSLKNKTYVCATCGKEFVLKSGKRKTCSDVCSKARLRTPEMRARLSSLAIDRVLHDEKFVDRLKTIRCEFEFKNEIIKCDSKVEYTCLDYFVKNFDVVSISRCDFSIPFEFEGMTRNYVPDFKIVTSDGKTYIVEGKCEFVNEHVRKKWYYYYETIPHKRVALEEYCARAGYVSFYFDRSMHHKFYDQLKIDKTTRRPTV